MIPMQVLAADIMIRADDAALDYCENGGTVAVMIRRIPGVARFV
jgi:hypothetical protein